MPRHTNSPSSIGTTPLVRLFGRLFSLPTEDMEHLVRLTTRSDRLQPRRTLIREGEQADRCFILKEGWAIEHRLLRDGARQILNFRLPGDVIGVECLAYKTALHSVATVTVSEVAAVSREELRSIQREFPSLGSALFLMSLREGAILHEWETSLGRRAAFQRVAHLFLEIFKRARIRGLGTETEAPFPATQQDIADCLGLTTPYVNRLIRELEDRELVSLRGRNLRIMNAEALAAAAKFKPDYLEAWRKSPFAPEARPDEG